MTIWVNFNLMAAHKADYCTPAGTWGMYRDQWKEDAVAVKVPLLGTIIYKFDSKFDLYAVGSPELHMAFGNNGVLYNSSPVQNQLLRSSIRSHAT